MASITARLRRELDQRDARILTQADRISKLSSQLTERDNTIAELAAQLDKIKSLLIQADTEVTSLRGQLGNALRCNDTQMKLIDQRDGEIKHLRDTLASKGLFVSEAVGDEQPREHVLDQAKVKIRIEGLTVEWESDT